MINAKEIKEIKYNPKSGIGYFVVGNKLTAFSFEDIRDDEEKIKLIIENGEVEEEFEIERKTRGRIFEYSIYNNGSYEFAEDSSLFSTKYFTRKEFTEMCNNATKALEEEYGKDDYHTKAVWMVASKVNKLYPNTFEKISYASGFNTKEWPDDDD